VTEQGRCPTGSTRQQHSRSFSLVAAPAAYNGCGASRGQAGGRCWGGNRRGGGCHCECRWGEGLKCDKSEPRQH